MPQFEYSSAYSPFPQTFQKNLLRSAIEPYQSADRYSRYFGRVKLRIDPAFTTILQQGLIPDGARLLDLGCGQGLLASILLSARALAKDGQWPEGWPPPPALASIRGIDSVPLDIQRAQLALGNRANFSVEDVCMADFGEADVIVILDVLHYIDYHAQDNVLRKVKQALPPNGRLILRVGNAAGGMWFKASYWYDRMIWFFRVGKDNPLYCRTLDEWIAALGKLGLSTRQIDLGKGVSLANTMLLATNTEAPRGDPINRAS